MRFRHSFGILPGMTDEERKAEAPQTTESRIQDYKRGVAERRAQAGALLDMLMSGAR